MMTAFSLGFVATIIAVPPTRFASRSHLKAPSIQSCLPGALSEDWESIMGLDAECIFSQPSSVSEDTLVEVYEHGRWRTLRFVDSDPLLRRHVQWTQSVTKVGEAKVIAFDYIKTMASIAFATAVHGDGAVETPSRVLFMGLGGGTLPQLWSSISNEYDDLTALEIDAAVIEAARTQLGLSPRVRVHTGDARLWLQRHVAAAEPQFDVIFIDIFDSENTTPPEFYSAGFLSHVRRVLTSRGVVVSNMHDGVPHLSRSLHEAKAAYAAAFPGASCHITVSSDSTEPGAGPAADGGCNVVLTAAMDRSVLVPLSALTEAARNAQAIHELPFDVAARLQGLQMQSDSDVTGHAHGC